MKTWFSALFGLPAVCLLIFASAAGAAQAVDETSDVTRAGRRSRIGIVMPSFRESRWQYDIQSLQAQAIEKNVDILVRFAGNDQQQQNIQVKELILFGIDALIMTPHDVYEAKAGADFAKAHGVPVLSYDRLVENSDVDAYVGFERLRVGELMGEFLTKVAPRGNYIIISGPKSDSNARDFLAGAMKYLTPLIERGDITVVAEGEVAGWHPDAAKKIVERALMNTLRITAVLAPNDDTAGGAIEALAARNLDGKVAVTGQDATAAALRRLEDGRQSMTVFKNPRELAQKAMEIALELVNKEPLETEIFIDNGAKKVPSFLLPVSLIDKTHLQWVVRLPEMQ